MKVDWLSDQNIFGSGSGAEANDRGMVEFGLSKGVDIKLVNPYGFIRPDALCIISNYMYFPDDAIEQALSKGAVFFLHDYVFCRWRLFYPGTEKCIQNCERAKKHFGWYQRAKGLIFLSPLHQSVHYKQFGIELAKIPLAVIPSAIKVDDFGLGNRGFASPKNSYLSVNTLLPFKGRTLLLNFINSHPDDLFTIVGHNPDATPLSKNVTFLGPQATYRMPNLYRSHRYYVELPDTPQPFNRTVCEGRLAGCELVVNNLVGAASYPWFKEGVEAVASQIRKAPSAFWEFIKKEV